jgi:hypothetical protein
MSAKRLGVRKMGNGCPFLIFSCFRPDTLVTVGFEVALIMSAAGKGRVGITWYAFF